MKLASSFQVAELKSEVLKMSSKKSLLIIKLLYFVCDYCEENLFIEKHEISIVTIAKNDVINIAWKI